MANGKVGDIRKQGKDAFILIRIAEDGRQTWSKDITEWHGRKHFFYYPCNICGKLISNCGFSRAHYLMHLRNKEINN